MADLVITEFMDEEAVTGLAADFDLLYDPTLVDRRDELLSCVEDARGVIIRNRTKIDAEFIAAAPSLLVVGRLGVGLDNIDLAACDRRHVAVHPATGANAAAVAEYVIGAILVLVRGVYGATDRMRAGEWPRTALAGGEIAGRRLGLVGFGGIARLVAEKAAALGMVVAAHDPLVAGDDPTWEAVERRATLDDLLVGSDAISLHVPLLDTTRNMLDAAAIALLPAGAIVVNTARGGVVDETALIQALRNGALGGAALDVFATEPMDARGGARFAGVPNLLLTPHIAGITEESNRRVSALVAARVRRVLEAAAP